ncbi:hypothetical protein ACF0H5_023056 [Mactra antiquata]
MGIEFNDRMYRDRESLTEQWKCYFRSLYSPAESELFDNKWRYFVEQYVNGYFDNVAPDLEGSVTSDTVSYAIQTLPKGKSPGDDLIRYEHLLFADLADDMVLVSLSRVGMNEMLHICSNYSRKWRYFYNVEMCGLINFNNCCLRSSTDEFTFGDKVIKESQLHVLLGVNNYQHLSSSQSMKDASIKLRGTLISIINSGIHPASVTPITLKSIYESIVLPKALYGCELWNFFIKRFVIVRKVP